MSLRYQNGGPKVRPTGEACVPGLFVAGESGGGIYGASRLMGNSLLDITVYGRIAGTSAKPSATNVLSSMSEVPRSRVLI